LPKADLQTFQVLFLTVITLALIIVSFYFYKKKNFSLFIFSAAVLGVFSWPATYFSMSVHSLNRSKTVEFCGSCHQMSRHIDDVTSKQSKSLAAKHYKRYWINDHQCYTCHTNYTLFGPIETKLTGLKHMYVSLFKHVNEEDIKIYSPYLDKNCMTCHDNERFNKPEEHLDRDPDESCVDCHDNIHKVRKKDSEEEDDEDEK
jgi:cytochrome c-type protein NapC